MQTQNLETIISHYTLFPSPILSEKPTVLGRDYFILYGKNLNLDSLLTFQQKCGENFLILRLFGIGWVHLPYSKAIGNRST